MWKITLSLASKCVELHVNPLRNLDWILGPHPRVFTNKRQPADTQARLWVGSWPHSWEQIDNIFLEQTDHQRLYQRMLPFPVWNRPREDFCISIELCLKETRVTEDSTDYPRFAVNSAVASVTRQGLIILCLTFMYPYVLRIFRDIERCSATAGWCHWAVIPCWAEWTVSLRIHSAHTGKHCSSQ